MRKNLALAQLIEKITDLVRQHPQKAAIILTEWIAKQPKPVKKKSA